MHFNINQKASHIYTITSVQLHVPECVSEWQKDRRCIFLRHRPWQMMRRLEKVEGRRGPGPAAAAGGVRASWEVWSMEPVIMQSCRVRLSVTVLS